MDYRDIDDFDGVYPDDDGVEDYDELDIHFGDDDLDADDWEDLDLDDDDLHGLFEDYYFDDDDDDDDDDFFDTFGELY